MWIIVIRDVRNRRIQIPGRTRGRRPRSAELGTGELTGQALCFVLSSISHSKSWSLVDHGVEVYTDGKRLRLLGSWMTLVLVELWMMHDHIMEWCDRSEERGRTVSPPQRFPDLFFLPRLPNPQPAQVD